jgi:NAD(P)-dependent dehydrogenase (short-subunit alcohol dehydrogenase family)
MRRPFSWPRPIQRGRETLVFNLEVPHVPPRTVLVGRVILDPTGLISVPAVRLPGRSCEADQRATLVARDKRHDCRNGAADMIDSRRFLMLGGGISNALACRVSELGGHALTVSRVPPTKLPVEHLVADLQSPQSWTTAVEEGFRRLGGIDVLVNCGGAHAVRRRLTERDDADWFSAVRADVLTFVRSCLRGIDLMSHAGGVIVNLTAVRPWPDDVLSAPSLAAFAALEATNHTLALAAAAQGLRLFGVAPQARWATHRRPERAPDVGSARSPLIAFVESVDVIESIVHLLEDPSAHDAIYRLDSGQVPEP